MNRLYSLPIRLQLFLIISLLSFFAAGIIIYSGLTLRSEIISAAKQETQSLALLIATRQQSLALSTEQLLTVLSKMPELRNRNVVSLEAALHAIISLNPQYSTIFVTDRMGEIWASALPVKSLKLSDRASFNRALAGKHFSSGQYKQGQYSGRQILSFYYPYEGDAGDIAGVIILGIDLNYHRPLMNNIVMPAHSSYLLLDRNGMILSGGRNQSLVGRRHAQQAFERMKQESETEAAIEIGMDGQKRFVSHRKLNLPGEQEPYLYVQAGIPVDFVLAKANGTLIQNLVIFLPLLLVVLYLAWLVGKRSITDRVSLLENSALCLAGGDMTVRAADHVSGGELGNLGRAFDRMAEQLSRREQDLQEGRATLRQILDTLPQAISWKDRNNIYLGCNKAFARTVKLDDPEKIRGKMDSDLPWPVVDVDKYRTDDGEILAGNGSKRHATELFQQEKGARLWIDTTKVPLLDSQGIITGILCVYENISERKQAEEELRKSNELFSLFMLHSPVYTFIKEVSPTRSIVLQASDNYREMIGVPGSSMVGKSMEELFPAELAARMTADDWDVVSRAEVLRLEEELNGRSYTTIKFPITRDDRRVLAGYTIDITEQKQAEEEKAKLNEQLLQAQKVESIGRLAGGVAHDFNNMLGVILGHVELAMGRIGPAAEKIQNDLQQIRKAAERSADLTRQLLAFARKQTVSPKVLNMNETVGGMIQMLQRLIGEDIDLHWRPGDGLWPIRIDPSQIDQILANLCVNSRDAITGIGKVTIETGNITFDELYCADHIGFVPGEYVLLAVSDNGCGMNKAILANLFEPFFTTKETGKGTGLGLATVYGIVKQNNGFINVYSEPGEGTTFRIYLPRHEKSRNEEERAVETKESTLRGKETILVVEDEPAILNLARLMLEEQGYRVLVADTPGEAIRLTTERREEIHLLLTDVVMPEMNGRDLAKRLFPFYPDLRCLFMSGYTANVIAHHGVLDEGVFFIQKPFSRNALAAKTRQALDQTK